MRTSPARYIVSLFFVALMVFKGATFLVSVLSSHLEDIPISELLMDLDQEEKKGSAKTETGPDELFDKAVLPADDLLITQTISTRIRSGAESLQAVYLDTLTPPPNT